MMPHEADNTGGLSPGDVISVFENLDSFLSPLEAFMRKQGTDSEVRTQVWLFVAALALTKAGVGYEEVVPPQLN